MLLFLMLVLLSVSLAPIHAAGQSTSFDLRAAHEYIKSQYNPSLGLVRENEHIEKYWLWSDNELAALVLRDYIPEISENITQSISLNKEGYELEFRAAYGVILEKDTSFLAPINKNITDKIWYTDFAGDGELQCTDYADIAFLRAIHYYKIGDYRQSTECYQVGRQMFDGIGFKDKAYAADSNRYSTYKVALWQISNDLARGGKEGVTEQARAILEKMQDKRTGGVYTHYTSGLVPDSQTNIETTSLAILVFDSSLLQPKVQPPTPEMLEECKELGIDEENCSGQAILTERSRVETPPLTQIDLLQNPTMLAMFGLLAAGIGGGAAVFYMKTRRGKKETGK